MPQVGQKKIFAAVIGGVAEWLFAMLPLVVVAVVTAHLGDLRQLLASVEWAFGAAILSAQSLVRFVQGALAYRRLSVDRVILGLAFILVVVVVPINIVLALVLSHELRHVHPGAGMITAQIALFIVASILFVAMAATSHLWQEMTSSGRADPGRADYQH